MPRGKPARSSTGPEARARSEERRGDDVGVAVEDDRSRSPAGVRLPSGPAGGPGPRRGQRAHPRLRAARLRQDTPAGRLGPPARTPRAPGWRWTRRTTTRDGCGPRSSRRLRACPAVPASSRAAQPRRAADDGGHRLPHRRARGARGPADARAARSRRRPPPPQPGGPARPAAPPAQPPEHRPAGAGEPVRPGAAGGAAAAWRSGCASCGPRSSASPPTETATLADLCGLDLTAGQTAAAPRPHRRLGGRHPARRAARCASHPDPDRFLADFSGDERPVADYLAGEVFAHISEAEGDLLRRTSISDPVPTALAAELSGRRRRRRRARRPGAQRPDSSSRPGRTGRSSASRS